MQIRAGPALRRINENAKRTGYVKGSSIEVVRWRSRSERHTGRRLASHFLHASFTCPVFIKLIRNKSSRRMSFRRSQRAFIDSRTQKESTHTKMHPGFIFITSQLHTYDRSLSKMAAGAPREQAGYKRMRTSSAIPRTRQSFSLHAID
ncbi:uncharacterized protein LOC125067200 isoform X1 [Vanessa atalanta]|uniref:uncharacterized protein LOC125067200 isoform X1 n=1 Tax=Vanessa atalanta TaxID=42275 RepID=UPI001FCCFE54|nr:uncharacterized protein LOC125067200 isoform X1 [Vanessa atalanta]